MSGDISSVIQLFPKLEYLAVEWPTAEFILDQFRTETMQSDAVLPSQIHTLILIEQAMASVSIAKERAWASFWNTLTLSCLESLFLNGFHYIPGFYPSLCSMLRRSSDAALQAGNPGLQKLQLSLCTSSSAQLLQILQAIPNTLCVLVLEEESLDECVLEALLDHDHLLFPHL